MIQDWIQINSFEHGDKLSGSVTEKLNIGSLTKIHTIL
jgi:hypothetical protein